MNINTPTSVIVKFQFTQNNNQMEIEINSIINSQEFLNTIHSEINSILKQQLYNSQKQEEFRETILAFLLSCGTLMGVLTVISGVTTITNNAIISASSTILGGIIQILVSLQGVNTVANFFREKRHFFDIFHREHFIRRSIRMFLGEK